MKSINPPGIDRLAQLNALHLYGMAAAWSERLAEGPAVLNAIESRLL
jgi:hypothetical protein